MASARNLCQHSDDDGHQCTSNDYILCPHCQLQLCLQHLNLHQTFLRTELSTFCDDIDSVRRDLDSLVFDSTNHRQLLFQQLDEWYAHQNNLINRIYAEKKQEIQILCLKSHMEFETYKSKKEKQLKENLIKQLKKVLKQKQIHIDDINEMKSKLDHIQRGVDELKQLKVDIHFTNNYFDINIIKRRYVEAAKPFFNDDDDNLWETDNEDDEMEDHPVLAAPSANRSITSAPLVVVPTFPTIIVKKAPLKLVIKRLHHPTISTEIKYKLQTVNRSLPVITS